MSFYCEWRALVGPYYDHYAWWDFLPYASTDDLEAAHTSLTLTLGGGTPAGPDGTPPEVNITTMIVADNTVFPNVGGLWVGPNGDGEAWEYIRYTFKTGTTSITQLVREPFATREHNGNHAANAAVKQWQVIGSDLGELHLIESLDANYTTITWRATMAGVMFPQWALRNNHLCVVQTRLAPTDDWAIQLVGVLDVPGARDNYKGHAEWDVTIRSIPDWTYGKEQARGIRIGDLNIAHYGNANSSAVLTSAFEERPAGEFTAAAPSFDGSMAIDQNLKTLWIAERYVGTPNTFVLNNGDVFGTGNVGSLRFSQLYLNPPPGTPPGARWIELALATGDFQHYWIASANGSSAGSAVTLRLPEDQSVESSGAGKIIIAEDPAVFRRLNPEANPALLINIKDPDQSNNAGFFNHLTPTGGDMWIFNSESQNWHGRVAWGDGHWGGGSHWPQYSGSPAIPPVDYGATEAALLEPDVGETIRYMYTADAINNINDYWRVSLVKAPGYEINNTDGAWIIVTLPGMGLKLAEDILDDEPGNSDLLRITMDDSQSTAGLPDTGTLMIGDEQIEYISKSNEGVIVATSGRGANGTTAAEHDAGDLVYLIDDGTPTDAHLIESVSWDRNLHSNWPVDFKLYTSVLTTARNPDEDDWESDWTLAAQVEDHDDNEWLIGFSPTSVRIRHILIHITKMVDDPSRPRLNEIRAILDQSVYFSELWLDNGQSAFDVIEKILVTQGGFPGAAVTESGTSPVIGENTTADGLAWPIAVDLAEYCGCQIVVQRDSTITISPQNLWTEDQEVGYTWDETNLADVALVMNNGLGVAQVRQAWRSPDGLYSGVEVYPASPVPPGEILEIPEVRYAADEGTPTTSAAAAQAAQRRYIVNRYPVIIQIDSADGVPTYRPDGTARIQWRFHRQMQEIDRRGLVINVEHSIKGGQWYTSAEHQQIEREAGN